MTKVLAVNSVIKKGLSMKKIILSLLSVLLIFAFLLSSCSSLITIEYEDGCFVDKKNGVIYHDASVSIEPVTLTEEYAKYKDTVFYEMKGVEPTEWFSEEYDGIGAVYYADGIECPTLATFEANKIYLCASEIITVSLGNIEDESIINAVIDAFENEEPCEVPDNIQRYCLKFVSEKYPFLYYNIILLTANDGTRYVYDRGEKLCVPIGTVFDDIIDGLS